MQQNKQSSALVVRGVLSVLGALSIVSCTEIDSRDLRSSGFHADIDVYSAGNSQTNVWVRLSSGSGIDADEIDLSAGDQLFASVGGLSKTLVQDSGVYLARFNTDEGGLDYVVALERSRDIDMPNSIVTLPSRFDILAPDAGELFNAGDTLNVAWSPLSPAARATVSYTGSCVSAVSRNPIHFGRYFEVSDNGAHSVPVNSVLNVFGDQSEFDRGSFCSLQISVETKNIGTLDPNYGKGGSISATQTRTVTVQVKP